MDIFEEWLFKAKEDVRLSELAFEFDASLGIAIFHTQQCAEKALKGFLAFKNIPLEKTHNLIKLLETCIALEPRFMDLREDVEVLNPFATEFRYPGLELAPERDDMEDAIMRANKVLVFVEQFVT